MRERDLIARLRAHFAPPEFAFLSHVRNGTGYSRGVTRTADGIAMSLWPSRGLDLHGFEVKVSRSDWLRERQDPAKADEIAGRCDLWSVVVSDPEIVKAGELPRPWGLIVPEGDGLKVVVEPQRLQAESLDRAFLAAILRRAAEAQACPEPTAGAIERARGRTGTDLPTEKDFAQLAARMERFNVTARRLANDIATRVDDLKRAERSGLSIAEIDERNARLRAAAGEA